MIKRQVFETNKTVMYVAIWTLEHCHLHQPRSWLPQCSCYSCFLIRQSLEPIEPQHYLKWNPFQCILVKDKICTFNCSTYI